MYEAKKHKTKPSQIAIDIALELHRSRIYGPTCKNSTKEESSLATRKSFRLRTLHGMFLAALPFVLASNLVLERDDGLVHVPFILSLSKASLA